MISSFVKKKGKKADQMLRAEEQVPDWIMQGMEAVEKAPSALNAQPVEFQGRMESSRPMLRLKTDLKRSIWGSQSFILNWEQKSRILGTGKRSRIPIFIENKNRMDDR